MVKKADIDPPADDDNSEARFKDMLLGGRWSLKFYQDADTSIPLSQRFQHRILGNLATGPIKAEMVLSFHGDRNERLFFAAEVAKLLKDRPHFYSQGGTEFITINNLEDIQVLLQRAADISTMDKGVAIATSIPENLCELVITHYLGNRQAVLKDTFSDWLQSGAFTLPAAQARLMVPERKDDKVLKDNIEALQYFCHYGKNRAEKSSPSRL